MAIEKRTDSSDQAGAATGDDRGFVNLKEVVAGVAMILPALRQESSQMPGVQKLAVWLSFVFMLGVLFEALVALPVAIVVFGWGYSV